MLPERTSLRILIVKPSSFGDIIQMLQVIEGGYHAADKQHIHLDIHWIVRDCFADFLKASPYVSKLFIFERNNGIAGFCKLIKQIRQTEYDWVIDGQGLLRSGLMTFFAKAKHKIGRNDAREGSRIFYQKTYQLIQNPAHAVEILQALMQPLVLDSNPQRPLTLNLEAWHFPFDKGAILLFPNSRGPKKEWPYFYELTCALLERTDKFCVWIGQKWSKQVPQHPRFINFIGKTKLSDLPLLIQNASCVIANDSGPVHLAAALNKPLVGIYGPTDGLRYGPYPIQQHCVLQAPSNDLKQLPTATVLKAILEQL